ncbi:MAG TPA: PadR family transcriptional regulator [Gemmatimonadales bacterium]
MASPTSNRTTYAILGLLADGPRSGYDIKREVEETLGHFWRESYGQIYPILRRLHQDGLVEKQVQVRADRPNRNEYSITSDGLAELRAWLARPVDHTPPRSELLLKVFFGRHGDPAAIRQIVQQYGADQSQALTTLTSVVARLDREATDDPSYPYWRMTAELGLEAMTAVTTWCAHATEELARMETR